MRSQICSGVKLLNSIMMGADIYESEQPYALPGYEEHIPIGIGHNCYIDGAIIDKNVRIGHDVVIKPFPRGTDLESGQVGRSGRHRRHSQKHTDPVRNNHCSLRTRL